ncbi:hypothetical protein QVD17_36628 [Tagetes erecta]|uniref:Myb-like domain-containing protein n=1 Tax=Tagetes erecta TaxID=13708 RepID=A0AAD8JYX7_TARER|nr:hypothetical protein QVD17_36628 [Tagetes erecta]
MRCAKGLARRLGCYMLRKTQVFDGLSAAQGFLSAAQRPLRGAWVGFFFLHLAMALWTPHEDETLTICWYLVRSDATRNDPNMSEFWNDVVRMYNSRMGPAAVTRDTQQCSRRWRNICQRTLQFEGYYRRALRSSRGLNRTREEIIDAALSQFEERNGQPFTSIGAWTIISTSERYRLLP